MKTKKKSEFAKLPAGDKVLMTICYIILGLFLVAIILPVIYIILASFIDPITLQNKGLTFDFTKWTATAYQRVLSNAQIWVGFKNALIYSILFTIISVIVTLLAAYPMSRADFKGKGFFNTIFVITMFFGGGLIPTYLLISNLGMLDTIWAILIPGAFSVWNMIIARTYYMGIPRDLQEAAEIDGATEMVYFFRILLPVCTPIIATIAMWQAVRRYVEQLLRRDDLPQQRLQAAPAAGPPRDPYSEPARFGNGLRHAEHRCPRSAGRAAEIRDDHHIFASSDDHVSLLPEVL